MFEETRLGRYWKLRRAYNTLNINYDVLKTECEYKERVITRQKNEIERLKEKLKNANNSKKRNNKKRR